MEYFVILIIILASLQITKGRVSNISSIVIVSLYLLFLYTIRNDSVGNIDIPRYVSIYDGLSTMSYSQVFLEYHKDFLFYLGCWGLSKCSASYTLMFFSIGSIFVFSVAKLIFNQSEKPLFSFLIFTAFFFSLNFSLLRHCVAFSMIILSYNSLKQDKLKEFFFFLTVGVLCQGTSIVGLLMLPLRKIKFRWWFLALVPALMRVSSVPALNSFLDYIDQDRFANYIDYDFKLNYTHIIIYAALFTYVLFLMRNNLREYFAEFSFELNMLVVGLAFMGMSIMIAEAHRLAMFFFFVIIIVIPNLMNRSKISINRLLSIAFTLFLVYYFLFISVTGADLVPFNTIL